MLLIMTKFQDVSLIAKRNKIKYSRTYKTPKIELADIQGVPKKMDFQNACHFLITAQILAKSLFLQYLRVNIENIMVWPSAD